MRDRLGNLAPSRRRLVATIILLAVIAAPIAYSVSTFNHAGANGRFVSTSGMEIYFDQDQQLGTQFPKRPNSDSLNFTTQTGTLNLSSPGSSRALVTDYNGTTWEANLTNIQASSNNITINPSEMNETTVGGDITGIRLRPAKVQDKQTDLIYSTGGGEGIIVVRTNATPNEQYGLIDNDTEEAIDVASAESNGKIRFTEVEAGSNREVRIEELGSLSIRNETEPHALITGANVEIKFFEDNDDDPLIVERTDSDNDGIVDLTGLPVDETFIVTVQNADPYFDRQIVVDDLSQQANVFLLNSTSQSSVDNRFEVVDRTGNFPAGETQIIIQKAINRTLYGGSPSGFQWTAIAGDKLGGDQAVQWDLAEGDRYRIIVENDDGDRRILGAYTAKQTGTIQLEIGRVVADPKAPDQIGAEAQWVNDSGTVTVEFDYNDSFENTQTLWVHIYERNNQSNELLANQSFNGPLGTQSITQTVPSNEEDKEWVVEFTANRLGENAVGRFIVGPQRTVLDGLPTWVKTIIALGTLMIVAGLFSQLNGDVGALVVAGVGGILWFVGFMPPEVSDGVVVLALITAGIMFIRERRGGGTGL